MAEPTDQTDGTSPAAPSPQEQVTGTVEYSVSPGLAARLARDGISLAFTSYQSGLLYFIGRNRGGGVNIHQTAMPKPMGLCLDRRGTLTMMAGFQIMRMENVLEPDQRINHAFDACFVPRRIYVTGSLDAHDVGLDGDDGVVFVNTRFNCLARPSNRHSFEPLWRPAFISALIDEDRCHLNGLAMEDGRPRYVTAVSRSNTIDGWTPRKTSPLSPVSDSLTESVPGEWNEGSTWIFRS